MANAAPPAGALPHMQFNPELNQQLTQNTFQLMAALNILPLNVGVLGVGQQLAASQPQEELKPQATPRRRAPAKGGRDKKAAADEEAEEAEGLPAIKTPKQRLQGNQAQAP
ncbi:hypothetical protein HYH02_008028 [Chlamydomonas schloesseri]|uniref:Uncharacterized protein n=1 Tax=Chlamydomonas schloesseri TaxID=2026947 RepID=A0A836B3S9_9CHLO|nr:hypothetical protein HYH02_008028 [Chlamydomonas schloesseri]|eukprot:KAG2446871.1 hypothetical protein HYH02_008028 [Chlamydomonas schloesseri]